MGYGALYMVSGTRYTVSPKTTMAYVHMAVCQNELKQKYEYRAHQENISKEYCMFVQRLELISEVIAKLVSDSARKPYFEVYYLEISLIICIFLFVKSRFNRKTLPSSPLFALENRHKNIITSFNQYKP